MIQLSLHFSREFIRDFINRKKGNLDETLLHYYSASENEPNDKKVCDLLITYGAQINCTDKFERTPLHRAVAARKFSVTKLLLNNGAYVNAQDANKNTPLHIASTINLQLCDILLRHGADPNIKNSFHESPVLRVVQGVSNAFLHWKKILKLLLDYGGNVVLRDLNQQNAIEVASRSNNKDVFDWCKQSVQNSTGKKLIVINLGLFSFAVAKPSCQSKSIADSQVSLNSFTPVRKPLCFTQKNVKFNRSRIFNEKQSLY